MEPVLIVILSLVTLVSFIWLVVLAFKTHVVWGLASLLLPLAVVVFAILHWRNTWIPFVINLVAGLLLSLLLVQMTSAGVEALLQGQLSPSEGQVMNYKQVEEEVLQRLERGEMTEEEAREEMARALMAALSGEAYRPSFMESETDQPLRVERGESPLDEVDINAKIEEALRQERARSKMITPAKPKRVQRWVESDLARASGDLGRSLRITTAKGHRRVGDLIDITESGNLLLEQRVQGGNLRFSIQPSQIVRYEIWEWVEPQ